jgi:ubiquitin C-terminal hydrolase
VLTFALNRIELDYETWNRKKINDRFEFPIELDVSKYLEIDLRNATKPDEYIYELKGIVIHQGGPYGGHYLAYIKDDLKQGKWDLEIP